MLRKSGDETFNVAVQDERRDIDDFAVRADPQKNTVTELGIVGLEIDQLTRRLRRSFRSCVTRLA